MARARAGRGGGGIRSAVAKTASQDASQPATAKPVPLWVTLLAWGALLGLVFYFWEAFSLVLLLLLAAGAVAALLRPTARAVARHMPGGTMLVGLAMWLLVAALLALLVLLLYDPVAEQLRRWPQTEHQLDTILQNLALRFGVDEPVTFRGLVMGLAEWLADTDNGDGGMLAALVDRLGVAVITIAVLVFGSMFLLTERAGELTRPIASLLPAERREAVLGAFIEIDHRLRWWLLGILISMGVVGTGAGLGFWLAGLEFWLPLAIFAGLAEIVPILGPTVAFLVALLFAAAQGTGEVVGVLITWAIVQIIEPYVLVPMVMRRAVHIPPVVTLFTVVLWARVFGPLGLLLAVPINITLWAMVDSFVLQPRQRRAEQRAPP